jgi:protein SCO1
MPEYYIEKIDTAKNTPPYIYDTIFAKIYNIHFTNQLHHPVSRENLEGKIVLLQFFCVNCNNYNQESTVNLQKVQRSFANNDSSLLILSVAVHPQQDSISALKNFADHYQVDQDKWWFLKGDLSEMQDLVNEVEVTDSLKTPIMQQWILLDEHQYVRGYYNGLDSTDVNKCMHDIALLMLEKEKK